MWYFIIEMWWLIEGRWWVIRGRCGGSLRIMWWLIYGDMVAHLWRYDISFVGDILVYSEDVVTYIKKWRVVT